MRRPVVFMHSAGILSGEGFVVADCRDHNIFASCERLVTGKEYVGAVKLSYWYDLCLRLQYGQVVAQIL